MQHRAEFERAVAAILARFFAQNARPPLPIAEQAAFAARLRQLVAERGLPRPLAPDESGAPGGMPEAEGSALATRVAGAAPDPLLAEAARQLVKACFYPEFRSCRDSFRECGRDGGCRRQQLERVRGRISGAHCVDCPHWIALAPERHADYLRAHWHAAPAEFDAHRDVFLPEDFRALRRWLHAAAREGVSDA